MFILIICSIQNEEQTVLGDELNVCSQQNTVGYIPSDVTVGWWWRTLWDIGSQTWQLLIHAGLGQPPAELHLGFVSLQGDSCTL